MLDRAPAARLLAYEILPEVARLAAGTLPRVDVQLADALATLPELEGPVVVVGNPPWRGHPAPRLEARELAYAAAYPGIEALMRDYAPSGERNWKWLSDDCLRFLRWSHEIVRRAGGGVVGLVLNHAWIRGLAHAGLRARLRAEFDAIYVLDLHGSRLRPEIPPDGGRDENVFGVRPGTAVLLLVQGGRPDGARARAAAGHGALADVYHADRWGDRAAKLAWLGANDVSTTTWTRLSGGSGTDPCCPVLKDPRYDQWPGLGELFGQWSIGMVSGHDARSYFLSRRELLARHCDLDPESVFEALYRPGELRWTAFDLHVRPRRKVMRLLRAPGARGLAALRQGGPEVRLRFLEIDRPIDNCLLSTQSTARAYAFPLLREDGGTNLDPGPLGLVNAEEAFAYVLETLGDPAYQRRCGQAQLYGFARIPPACT